MSTMLRPWNACRPPPADSERGRVALCEPGATTPRTDRVHLLSLRWQSCSLNVYDRRRFVDRQPNPRAHGELRRIRLPKAGAIKDRPSALHPAHRSDEAVDRGMPPAADLEVSGRAHELWRALAGHDRPACHAPAHWTRLEHELRDLDAPARRAVDVEHDLLLPTSFVGDHLPA